jgi:hypothetical protein
MSLRDTHSVVRDLREVYYLSEPAVAQIVRNEPITVAERRMAEIRARELATNREYHAGLARKELWALQTLKLQTYLLNAPIIKEN